MTTRVWTSQSLDERKRTVRKWIQPYESILRQLKEEMIKKLLYCFSTYSTHPVRVAFSSNKHRPLVKETPNSTAHEYFIIVQSYKVVGAPSVLFCRL